MKRAITVFCFLMLSSIIAIAQDAQAFSTIHLMRNGKFVGSACATQVHFPNQTRFLAGAKKDITYKIYSTGEIAIDLEVSCPATDVTPAKTSSHQLALRIEPGKEYYIVIDVNDKRNLYVVSKDEYAALVSKLKQVETAKYEEDLQYPINKSATQASKEPVTGNGTGFLIASNGYIVTNNHVVENAKTISIRGVNGDFNQAMPAVIVAVDKSNDLAILRTSDKAVKFVAPPYIIRGKGVETGEDISVLGYPYADNMGKEVKLTTGIVSAKSGFEGNFSNFQLSAAVNPGNSGGPVFDKSGNLIGVVNARHSYAQNAGYAIKTSYLKVLLDMLDEAPVLTEVSTLADSGLQNQVKSTSPFVYIIEVSK